MPPDHLLRRITAAVDLSFVTELVSDYYCPDNARPSWDPWVLFKVVFLQFLYNLSDRQVEEQVNLHLACKWFVGRELAERQPDETGPDYSALCRFRARLGPEKFQEMFNRIVQQARQAGLVHNRLRLLDATHLAAKVDLFRLPSPPPETPPAPAPGQRSSLILKQNRTHPQVLGQANPRSQRKRPNLERKFAEQKQYHGWSQARYWGLRRVTLQVLMTRLVVNCTLRHASVSRSRTAQGGWSDSWRPVAARRGRDCAWRR